MMQLLPKLQKEFPDHDELERKQNEFREHPVIRTHGGSVMKLIDQIITDYHDPRLLQSGIIQAGKLHTKLLKFGLKGEHFPVSLSISFRFLLG